MQSTVLQDLLAFTDYLRQSGHLDVSFSALDPVFAPYYPILCQYEIHTNPYCAYLKSQPLSFQRCIAQKNKVRKQCAAELCYGCCYAGVEEYRMGVFAEETCIAQIHVSGYRGRLPEALAKRTHLAQMLPHAVYETLKARYQSALTDQIPPAQTVQAAITPLGYLFEKLYAQAKTESVHGGRKGKLYRAAIAYLCDHYGEPLTQAQMARALYVSESYLHHTFTELAGQTPQAYLMALRIRQSKHLLCYSRATITEIALACGFSDANYFSSVFHKKTGKTPSAYRKAHPDV